MIPVKAVHILDDPMPEYGDHEPTDDPLQILRHSTAHLLAAAVTEMYPGTKYAIGPAIKEPPGFYYDFDFAQPISESDLPAIESRMRRIAQEGRPFEKEMMPREKAIEEFRERGQDYKLELIADKVSGDGVSVYRTGDFLDLCLGPHVNSTRDLKAFKLQRVSGAYWRGDEKKPQLTRIYGTAWQSQKELDDYLKFLEEAEKRDHKKLGKDLKLFAVDDRVGPGLPLWLPDGATIRRELERFIVDEELARGYQHVRTPDVARLDLFRQSGHAQLYAEYMYPPMKFEDGEELELRPVNCPHHIVVYQTELRSYRDLPLRIAEIGNNWRYERSGTLAGMNRVRSFALNDAHIFCTPDQLMDEVRGAIDLALYFSKVLGIDEFWYQLSTRDNVKEKWLGTEEQWQVAQANLSEALESMGQKYQVGAGEAAFYGPKIDFQVRSYLIERYAGAFPTWLHPTQVVVAPVKDEFNEYAREVAARLRGGRVRVDVDQRSERLDKKVRDAKLKKVPYLVVVGAKEVESGHVNAQNRVGEKVDMPLESFVEMIAAEIAERRR